MGRRIKDTETDTETVWTLPPSGAFIITNAAGRELFRVTSTGDDAVLVEGAAIEASGPPEAHAASHQNGGADEIDVTGLTGAGGGGGAGASTFTLYTKNWDDVGLLDPANKGVLLFTLTAGQAARVSVFPTDWNQDAELTVSAGPDVNSGFTVADVVSGDGGIGGLAAKEAGPFETDTIPHFGAGMSKWILADATTHVYLAAYSVGTPPSMGVARVLAEVVTPA